MKVIQIVRLLDVLVIGPCAIYIAFNTKLPKAQKYFLITVGIGTILFNGYNYFKYAK